MNDNKESKNKPQMAGELEIDLMLYVRKLWKERWKLLKAAGIGALIGLVIAFSLPRQYTVEVTLAPESSRSGSSARSLSSMAAMLGLASMGTGTDVDALNVLLYPDIVASTPFMLELFDTHITTVDNKVDTTLTAYLEMQKRPWWSTIMGLPGMAIGGIRSLFSTAEEEEDVRELNPFQLTRKEAAKVGALRRAIKAAVDKKTGITTIAVTMQDPMVTAMAADTVVSKLQEYITAYRVSKSQQDCNYLEQLYEERQQEYYAAQQNYAKYIDANKGVILQSALTERERLQNEMNLAYQVYTQVATQLQVARAKVQEAKPVFAVVEPASVPLKPSGTSKKILLLGFAFLAVASMSAWVMFGRDIVNLLKAELKQEH